MISIVLLLYNYSCESFTLVVFFFMFFFCKQKTAYELRISDWSSDVCSSDLTSKDGLSSRNLCCQPIHIVRLPVSPSGTRFKCCPRVSAAALKTSSDVSKGTLPTSIAPLGLVIVVAILDRKSVV